MSPKRQLRDGAGPSRASKSPKSTPCFSENITNLSKSELEALLIEKCGEIEKLQAEKKEMKEMLFNFQGHTKANQSRSFSENITSLSTELVAPDRMLDNETDGDVDARSDHNITQHYSPTQGHSAGMQERQPILEEQVLHIGTNVDQNASLLEVNLGCPDALPNSTICFAPSPTSSAAFEQCLLSLSELEYIDQMVQLNNGTDGDQNVRSDHNIAQQYNQTQASKKYLLLKGCITMILLLKRVRQRRIVNHVTSSSQRCDVFMTQLIKKYSEIEKLQAELKDMLFNFQGHTNSNQRRIEALNNCRYEIRILGTIKEPVYTDSDLQGEGGSLKVEIRYNGEKITWEPFASAEFEIVVIKEEFPEKDQQGWSADEFLRNLVKERKKVGPILAGTCRSKFSKGEAELIGLKFKDNSNRAEWRLGIRVLGNFNVRVIEAISEPFRVRDRHGKAFEKWDPLSLDHEVEHIKKVGKKRALNLRANGIRYVKDFLKLYHKDKTKLLEILEIDSEKDDCWKIMIGHVKMCDAGPNHYNYAGPSTSDIASQSGNDSRILLRKIRYEPLQYAEHLVNTYMMKIVPLASKLLETMVVLFAKTVI